MESIVDMESYIKRNSGLIKKISIIALPVALQSFLGAFVNMVDTIMVGSLGEVPIAAVGLGNKVFYVYTLLLFGISSGASILAAQYWGEKNIPDIKRVLGIALLISTFAGLLFFIPCLLRPESIMQVFTKSEETITLGKGYLTVVCFSYLPYGIITVYTALLRSIHRIKVPIAANCIAIVINISLNYILIYGKAGFPLLGAVGAAYATVIARVTECLILVIYIYWGKTELAASLKELTAYSRDITRSFKSTSIPVIANELLWGLGVTIYSLIYGRMGNQAVAVITITSTIQDLTFIVFQGLGAATAIILGNELGRNQMKKAESYSKVFLQLQFLFALFVGAACILFRNVVISIYNVTPETAADISRCLIIFAFFTPFRMFNYINLTGILRSGGDTKVCFLLDCGSVWLVGIPLAFLSGMVFGFPVYVVYGFVFLEEVVKAVFGYFRYRSKTWLCNLTYNPEIKPGRVL